MRFSSRSLRIERLLLKRIESGDYPHDSYLPSEKDLADEFNAARNTIRKALSALAKRGVILKSQGRMSRINFPGSINKKQQKYLAWLWYLPPAAMTTNAIYFEMLKLMVESARAEGLWIQIFDLNTPGKWQEELMHDNSCIGAFSVGNSNSIICRAAIDWLKTLPRLIAINNTGSNPGHCTVSIDNYTSGRIAAEHLLDTGAENILMLHRTEEADLSFLERMKGFCDTISAAPAVHSVKEVVIPGSEYYHIMHECEKILRDNPGFDAIFCLTDQLALSMLDAADRLGKSVPQDIAIMGFDGIYAGQHVEKTLTTIGYPLAEIVRCALDLALEFDRNGGAIAARSIYFPGRLLLGKTTGEKITP